MRLFLFAFLVFLNVPVCLAGEAKQELLKLPFSKGEVPFDFVRKLSILTPDDAVAAIEEKGVRVFLFNEKKITQLSHFAMEDDEFALIENETTKSAEETPMLAYFMPKGKVLQKWEGINPRVLSQDTIVVFEGKRQKGVLSHEWLHREISKLGPATFYGVKIDRINDVRVAIERLETAANKLNVRDPRSLILAEQFGVKIGYLKLLFMFSLALEELDVHMLLYEQRLDSRLDKFIPLLHLETLLDTVELIKSSFGEFSPDEVSADIKSYLDGAKNLEKLTKILVLDYLEYTDKNFSELEKAALNKTRGPKLKARALKLD